MKVREYMTEKVFTLNADKKLFVVMDIMNWAHVRHVPIVDRQNHLLGLISHRDLLAASISTLTTQVAELERQQHLWAIQIEKVMKKDVLTVSPDASVQEAASLMRQNKIGCLPVIENGKLAGIITESDLLLIIENLQQ